MKNRQDFFTLGIFSSQFLKVKKFSYAFDMWKVAKFFDIKILSLKSSTVLKCDNLNLKVGTFAAMQFDDINALQDDWRFHRASNKVFSGIFFFGYTRRVVKIKVWKMNQIFKRVINRRNSRRHRNVSRSLVRFLFCRLHSIPCCLSLSRCYSLPMKIIEESLIY